MSPRPGGQRMALGARDGDLAHARLRARRLLTCGPPGTHCRHSPDYRQGSYLEAASAFFSAFSAFFSA
jgi:hypothetical protein